MSPPNTTHKLPLVGRPHFMQAIRLLLALLFCVEEGSGLALAHNCAGHKLWESLELEAQSPRRELQV